MGVLDRALAAVYDPIMRASEVRGLREMRAELLADLSGTVVEIGAGTGLNLEHYPTTLDELVLAEPTPEMAAKLEVRAASGGPFARIVDAPAEQLPLPDGSADHVVSTLVLCTVDNPMKALVEIRRVLRPGGSLRLIEHVAHPDAGPARMVQDTLTPVWRHVARGCHLNRDTLDLLERTGFDVTGVERTRLPGSAGPLQAAIAGVAISP